MTTGGNRLDAMMDRLRGRIKHPDAAIAVLFGGLTWVLLLVWGSPWIHPAVWDDMAVAYGVRPATRLLPGMWTAVTSVVHLALGGAAAAAVLRIAGHVLLAGTAVLVYTLLREFLAFVMRASPQVSLRRMLVMRLASAVGTAAFLAADPVWTSGQVFSKAGLLLLLALGAIELFFVFLRKGAMKWAYGAMFLLGLLSAETSAGFALLAAFAGVKFLVLYVKPELESAAFKPAAIAVGKWNLTVAFVLAFVLGVALNCVTFALHDGFACVGGGWRSLPLQYLGDYVGAVTDSADPLAALIFVFVCIAPLAVSLFRLEDAVDEEQFLSYSTGVVFLSCGVVTFLQCASFPSVWFWNYFPIRSDFLLMLGLLLCAMTVSVGVMVLGVDTLCRNHRRLMSVFYGNEDDGEEVEGVMSRWLTDVLRRSGVIVALVLAVIAMTPGRVKGGARAMLAVVRDAVVATADDAGPAARLFTDGKLDSAIELASVMAGHDVKCISLMGGKGRADSFLRLRGLVDAEDRQAFGVDAATGLRSWIRDRPEKLTNCVVQLGFGLWKRDGKPLPEAGGLLARPTGWSDAATRRASVERAVALADRILALCESGAAEACGDAAVRAAFDAVTWRLARLCAVRGESAGLVGDVTTAVEEAKRAEKLNEANGSHAALVKAAEAASARILDRLTPREGLQLSLVRGDFASGKIYAETVLEVDRGNPDANFAMGMYWARKGQLAVAEEYLSRGVERAPCEPAFYNNLAVVQYGLGRLDEAEANVERALALIPDSAEALDTKKKIVQARAAKK